MKGHEAGISLPELMVATFLIGLALIPLLRLYPATLGYNVSNDDMILSFAAIRKAEEVISLMRVRGTSVSPSGTATCPDLPNCLLVWTTTTEASSSTSGVGWLKDVTVVACKDLNSDNSCDPGEPQVLYATKVTSRP